MATLSECLINLTEIANVNTQILKAINESFLTKQNHLTVNVNGSTYNIPSYLSLESKINNLQANFENLLKTPEFGEAYFNIDGNSKAIYARSYEYAPSKISIKNINNINQFKIDNNDVFKDFLTPTPYIELSLEGLPNDINSIIVKKFIPKSQELKDKFVEDLDSKTQVVKSWADILQLKQGKKEDVDYVEYDSTIRIPIKNLTREGTYTIKEVISDTVDSVTLDNTIVVEIEEPLTYTREVDADGSTSLFSQYLTDNDELILNDNSVKFKILEIDNSLNTLKLEVKNREYVNLAAGDKIKLYDTAAGDKSIRIPLEEDEYIFISVAPYNERMNIRANWSEGFILDTYKLQNSNNIYFKNYYDNNVSNLGDILFELTKTYINSYASKLTEEEFKSFTEKKPVIDESNLVVAHINKHLNDTSAVKTIKSLYNTKKQNEASLREIQEKILEVNNKLSSISYDDTTGIRVLYTSQLSEYNNKKNEIITSITKNIDAIASAALNAETPIEAAKYRIRGFYKLNDSDDIEKHVIGVKVQYRYKNTEQTQGNAISINDGFIFSDWNEVNPFIRNKKASFNNGVEFKLEKFNDKANEPSCNQIDIPISQGETVDIRVKFIYDFSYPLIQMESDWSDIVNVAFPDEFRKDIQVTTILEENNNDIETNRFQNILHENGVTDHISDKLTDQDLTYFHKPESIASGFYTAERRIIPLKDKLTELDNMIKLLQNTIDETSGQLSVSIKIGNVKYDLNEGQYNEVTVANYSQFVFPTESSKTEVVGNYIIDGNGIVTVHPKISLKNNSDKYVRLYSMFPGPRETELCGLNNSKYGTEDHTGIYYLYPGTNKRKQTANQFITFRNNNPYDSKLYYGDNNTYTINDLLSLSDSYLELPSDQKGATLLPSLNNHNDLCMDDDNKYRYKLLAPGEEVLVPLKFMYKLDTPGTSSAVTSISKTMSFDLRTSLYEDPKNYTFRITANYNPTQQNIFVSSNNEVFSSNDINYPITI